MSQEVKKGLLRLWLLRALQIFLAYFQESMWCYLLTTKDSLMEKVWGKTFFRCETPWTALTEIDGLYHCVRSLRSEYFQLDMCQIAVGPHFFKKRQSVWLRSRCCVWCEVIIIQSRGNFRSDRGFLRISVNCRVLPVDPNTIWRLYSAFLEEEVRIEIITNTR